MTEATGVEGEARHFFSHPVLSRGRPAAVAALTPPCASFTRTCVSPFGSSATRILAPVLPAGATEWVFATSANVDTVIALIAAQTGGGLLPRLALAPIVAVSSGRWESVR